MLNAIFFDLDGTLCRFNGNFNNIFNDSCAELLKSNLTLNSDEILNFWNKEILKEEAVSAFSIFETICKRFNSDADPQNMASKLCQSYISNISLIQGVADILFELSEFYKLVLVTNGPLDMQNATINALGIRRYFDEVIISGDPLIKFRKPNPLIFQLALDKISENARDVMMVGDNLKVDIVGAKSLGMQTILVGEANDCDVQTIKDIGELIKILKLRRCVHISY